MIYLGVDVQTARGVAWAALDEDYRPVDAGVLERDTNEAVASALVAVVGRLRANGDVELGIDAPRMPLGQLRTVRWTGSWRPCAPVRGRHCEIVVRVAGIANPQWTPLIDAAPVWMRLGFELFRGCETTGCNVHEVFPSASYSMLRGCRLS